MAYPQFPSHPSQPRTGGIVAAVLVGLWLVAVALLTQGGGWLVAQVLLALGLDQPAWVWPLIGFVALVLAGLAGVLLWRLPQWTVLREIGRAWTVGAGVLAVGSGLRAFPGTQNELFLLVGGAAAALAAGLLRRRAQTGSAPVSAAWGALAGLAVLFPFLWAGALGGVLETALAAGAAAALGALAASTLDAPFWEVFGQRRVFLGGLVAGVTLTLFAGGFGGNGVQVLLFWVLPPLGFAAAALRRAWPMVGIAAFGPLAFVDPVEVNFFLLNRDVPFWATIAAAIAWLIALVVGVAAGLSATQLSRVPKPVALVAAGATLLAGGVVYAVAGQPGFYGNQLFVVLKDQASLEGLPTTTGLGMGRAQRVEAVYRRLVDHAVKSQAGIRRDLDRLHLSYQPYYLVNAILVSGGPEIRAWLQARSDVDRVLLDQRLRPLPADVPVEHGDITGVTGSPQWNIQMVGAPDLWARGVTGKGITIGTSDSGVDGKHPALESGYRSGDDSWYDPWNGTTQPTDNGGHGTHTIATALGRQGLGVAPGAEWIGCVNLDRNMGSPSFYLDCMQFMLAPFKLGADPFTEGRPARAPNVLTNSWGCPPLEGCDTTVLRPATAALAAAGIAFVAAAGNEGPRCGSIDEPPADDPAAFSVAAVTEKRAVADFSSRGRPGSGKPDIAAPGEEVLSAMPGGTYGRMDGTSMATPHVAGAIALLWSAHNELVGDLGKTYDLLRSTTTRTASAGDACGQSADEGAGIVNAARAVAAAGE